MWRASGVHSRIMRLLRKFFVELILVGILVGWALLRFPEVFDPFIPWIVWAILCHLTWEVLLERDAVRAGIGGIEERHRRMAWIVAFVFWG
jgi:hypothetical protein